MVVDGPNDQVAAAEVFAPTKELKISVGCSGEDFHGLSVDLSEVSEWESRAPCWSASDNTSLGGSWDGFTLDFEVLDHHHFGPSIITEIR